MLSLELTDFRGSVESADKVRRNLVVLNERCRSKVADLQDKLAIIDLQDKSNVRQCQHREPVSLYTVGMLYLDSLYKETSVLRTQFPV